MSDEPNKPARDARGRLLPGNTANPGGRPTLPSWFTDLGPDALRFQWNAMVTGKMPVVDEPADGEVARLPQDDDEVERTMVATSVRAEIADRLTSRIYGRALQAVELTSEELSAASAALLALAAGKTK